MRAAAIALLFLVIGFIVNAVLVFNNATYRSFLQSSLGKEEQDIGTSFLKEEKQESDIGTEDASGGIGLEGHQSQELEKTLNRLADGIQALSGTSGEVLVPGSMSSGSGAAMSSTGGTELSATSGVEIPAPPIQKSLELPLFLQARLYPEYTFKKFDSKSPFGVTVFSNLEFATYRDTARNVRIYVFKDSYATTIANFRMATNVYSVKEVDAFFEKTFFLNTVKKADGMIRFVILEKTGVYGFEMPKGQYPKIKNYLQSK